MEDINIDELFTFLDRDIVVPKDGDADLDAPVPPPVPIARPIDHTDGFPVQENYGLDPALVPRVPKDMLTSSADLAAPPGYEHLNHLHPYALAVHTGLARGYDVFEFDLRTFVFSRTHSVPSLWLLPLSIPNFEVGVDCMAVNGARRRLPRLEFPTRCPIPLDKRFFYVFSFDAMTHKFVHMCRIYPVHTVDQGTTFLADVRLDLPSLPTLWQVGIYHFRIACTDVDLSQAHSVSNSSTFATGVMSPPFRIFSRSPALDTRGFVQRYIHRSLLRKASGQQV